MVQTRPYLVMFFLCSTSVLICGCPLFQVDTPNIANRQQSVAEMALSAAGLKLGVIQYQPHAAMPAGWVIRQEPAAGTPILIGSSVNLVLSNGSIFTTVPDIANILKSDAVTELMDARLEVGVITGQRHPTAPAGTVLSQQPEAGSEAIAGSAVAIVLSSGNVLRVQHDSPAPESHQDGLSWVTAFDSLQEAVDTAAFMGDLEIWVSKGTYAEERSLDADGALVLAAGVDLYGGFEGLEFSCLDAKPTDHETIIDGANGRGMGLPAIHVVKGAEAMIFDGFTVRGGDARGTGYRSFGGGMLNAAVSPSISRCVFKDNIAYQGGGMCNLDHAAPSIRDCVFRENTASWAGGMSNTLAAYPTVTDCLFTDNKADFGGGLGNTSEATSLIQRCTFSANTAQLGGGMVNWSATPDVQACTFSGNTATRGGGICNGECAPGINASNILYNTAVLGGGIYNTNTTAIITNCTLSKNAAELGGAVYNAIDASTMLHNSLSQNTADYGGGIFNSYCASCPVVLNCILWGNVAIYEGMEIFDEFAMPLVAHSCIEGGYPEGSNIITDDPRFLDSANDDLRLDLDSSCRDTGTADTVTYPDLPAQDIRGVARPQGAGYDIGAYEME